MNIETLLSKTDIEKAFRGLRKKRYKKSLSELKRYNERENKRLNSLGQYLESSSPSSFYRKELGSFSFDPYYGLKIRKTKKKFRPLLIPSSKDRVVLTAIWPLVRDKLAPELKKRKALGLGFNEEKETIECKRVLDEILDIIQTSEAEYVLKLDFKDFFSSIDRNTLLRKLSKLFKGKDERRLYRFIKASIENKIEADADFHGTFGRLRLRHVGVPQGLTYSPLLASFYALPLDVANEKDKFCKSFRYLDDMIVLTKTKSQAEEAYKRIKKLSDKLRLTLHPLEKGSKTQVVDTKRTSFEFLGIGISKSGLFIPDDAKNGFKETFKREIINIGILKKYDRNQILSAYESYTKGWVNHYKTICPKDFPRVMRELNAYIKNYLSKKRVYKVFRFSELDLNLF